MKLSEIANKIEGTLYGDAHLDIQTISALEDAKEGSLSFILEKKFIDMAHSSQASAFITFEEVPDLDHQIVVNNPKKSLATTIALFQIKEETQWQISDKADISDKATLSSPCHIAPFSVVGDHSQIGKNSIIHPHVSIGKHCIIGENCRLFPGVVLYDHVTIGDHVTIHANAAIGFDGFGYYRDQDAWHHIPHIGQVIIGDHVDIGANTCIARGCIGDTIIQSYTKIDTLNHFAHNTKIGKDCAMASHIAFAGSTALGDHSLIGGQAGFAEHVKVGQNTQILARAGVTKNIPENSVISGFPAQDHQQENKERATLKHLSKK